MTIKFIRASFSLPSSGSGTETIGFTVELKEGQDINQLVADLRTKAIELIGESARQLYEQRRELKDQVNELERKLFSLQKEWNATAEFLRAQGIKPDAPSMPQFSNLLAAANPEMEVVAEFEDEEYEEDDEDYN